MKKIGGKTAYECVRNITEKFFNRQVQKSITLTGGGKNKSWAFKNTEILKCITTAVTTTVPRSTEKEVEECLKTWLKHSNFRK